MGRTVPSFRVLLESIVLDLAVFRRALRGEDRSAFDIIMNMARKHASSSTVAAMLDPMDSMFLSILIEQQKDIKQIQEALNASSGCTVRQRGELNNMLDKKE
ncbi:MAG: hypothetical protein OIN86_07075 [Candidatus Methanoperedens sp.]|nr:hypothetical protein [Candidatus Methanoperedens sp.]